MVGRWCRRDNVKEVNGGEEEIMGMVRLQHMPTMEGNNWSR